MELFNSRNNIIRKLTESYKKGDAICQGEDFSKVVIFSDHHRGNRGVTDYFNEKAYNAALGYYLERDYTLILAGDVEEFWECHPRHVIRSYPLTYELESEFHRKGRLIKLHGNHDNLWKNKNYIQKYLSEIFGEISVKESVKLRIPGKKGEQETEVFITHGHQGTFLNDTFAWFGMFWLRYLGQRVVRPFKRRYQTPATNYSLREKHEGIMFDWVEMINASSPHRILFVAGHTHHPIFMSHNVVQRITDDITVLKRNESRKNNKLAARLRSKMEYIRADVGSNMHLFQKHHYYFNAGCCSYFDNSITGVEISRSKIKLVKWQDESSHAQRIVLGSERIREI